MKDAVAKALDAFMREKRSKRGFLLTEGGAFFLYDNKFCSISEYDIRLKSCDYNLFGKAVNQPVFASLSGNELLGAAIPEGEITVDSLRLTFHIPCGETPEELLRGVFFAKGQQARLALFTDPAIEEVILMIEKTVEITLFPPFSELLEQNESCNRSDLRMLTELYLKGQALKSAKILENSLKK